MLNSRSRSFIEEHPRRTSQESRLARDPHPNILKIDQEIDNFERRIAQLQEEKRKLNIEFTPFVYDKTYQHRTPVRPVSPANV